MAKDHSDIRVGICGLGRAGLARIVPELEAVGGFHVVAGHDKLAARMELLQSRTGAVPRRRFSDLLGDPAVELVVIATRSSDHAAMALAALRARKHVVVEKPLATTLRDVDLVIRAARRSVGSLFALHNRRFDAPFLALRSVIDSGKIGTVFEVRLRQQGYQRRADWQTLRRFGGGQLLNWGPHLVDWGMQLIDGPARDVWADLKQIAAAGDCEDHVKLMIRGASGVVADIEISGASAIREPHFAAFGSLGAATVEQGAVHVRSLKRRALQKVKASAKTPESLVRTSFSTDDLDWRDEEIALAEQTIGGFWHALRATLRGGKRFPISLAEARENMRVIEMARKGRRLQ